MELHASSPEHKPAHELAGSLAGLHEVDRVRRHDQLDSHWAVVDDLRSKSLHLGIAPASRRVLVEVLENIPGLLGAGHGVQESPHHLLRCVASDQLQREL